MPCTPDRCPLCGQPNECQLATQGDYKGPCWCMDENFPPDLLARVPDESRRCACLCRSCVTGETAAAGNAVLGIQRQSANEQSATR